MLQSVKIPAWCIVVTLLLICTRVVAEEQSKTVEVTTERLVLRFDIDNARPESWRACAPSCSQEAHVSIDFTAPALTPIEVSSNKALRSPRALEEVSYTLRSKETEDSVLLEFISDPIERFGILKKSYAISKQNYEVAVSIELLAADDGPRTHPNAVELGLTVGEHFARTSSAGFARFYERVRTLYFDGREVKDLVQTDDDNRELTLIDSHWVGIRNRFWAILIQAEAPGGYARAQLANGELPHLAVAAVANPDAPVRYKVYSGPILLEALSQTSEDLPRLLFSGLWWWLRWLSLGLLFILNGLYVIIGNYGVAIIALALVVKLLMSPLTVIAEKWQHEVNVTRSKLHPLIDEIKANYKGEEQVIRILAVYKAHDTNMFYSLKSMFGFLIQIPIFIAVFDMLSENFDLYAVPFLWIEDLAKPDHFIKLPFLIPFFGEYVNLLPFVMTFVTVLASVHFEAHTLSPQLKKKQQRHLFAMAALFFVLFYTFPAGMVLYWTSTNFIQFVKDQTMKIVRAKQTQMR